MRNLSCVSLSRVAQTRVEVLLKLNRRPLHAQNFNLIFFCKTQVIKSLRKFIAYERQEGLRKNAPTVIISASVSLFKSFFLTIVKEEMWKSASHSGKQPSTIFFSESKGIWFGYSFKPDIKSWNESELNWFTFNIATAVKELISPLFLFRF